MRVFAGRSFLRLLGGLCAAAGVLAWIGVAWEAISSLEGVSPQNDEGRRLLVRGLTGTLLMIAGMVVLHVAAVVAERGEGTERIPPR